METSSIAEGSFMVLPDNFTLSKFKKATKRKADEKPSETWKRAFSNVWKTIENEIKNVNDELFSKVLEDLINYIQKLPSETKTSEGVLPCQILLTGTNLPDHRSLLCTLSKNIKEKVSPHLATLWSKDSSNLKNAVSSIVQQIVAVDASDEISDELEEILEELSEGKKAPKNQLQPTLSSLVSWYNSNEKEKKNSVVIIFPDFESLLPGVLSELIILLSTYSSTIPFILIFGVATTPSAVYQCLPRHVLSQLAIQIFRSEPSITFLNHVIENIFFSEKCPFRLGSKCITFLTDIFLFHSFSVSAFIQGFKFCLMEHFYKKNHMSLCCDADDLEKEVKLLTAADIENIRKLPSFQTHVEKSAKDERKLLLLDDECTRRIVLDMIKTLQEYTDNFHVALKCLHILTNDLPQSPLGKHVREYYCKAVSSSIKETKEYKDCLKLLQLQSRCELLNKINLLLDLLKISSIVDILSLDKNTTFDQVITKLEEFKKQFNLMESNTGSEDGGVNFEDVRRSFLNYIESEIIDTFLQPPTLFTLHEIIYFDDLVSVRRRISGAPRGAIHMALNNPQYYLECKCCELPNQDAVVPSLPDLSVAYKLHLECNKIINLFDWLQAFDAAMMTENSESDHDVSPEIQARFTRAVSELQFLGFIKPSRSKSDHVTRLTWGNA